MGLGFPQIGGGFGMPAATAGEEPPGDPTALRQAARVLGGDSERGFRDASKVLDAAARDVTSADSFGLAPGTWVGSAGSAWAADAGSVSFDAGSLGRAVEAAAGVLSKLAAEIQEAKDRAARARGRAERNADALASAELGLTRLAGTILTLGPRR